MHFVLVYIALSMLFGWGNMFSAAVIGGVVWLAIAHPLTIIIGLPVLLWAIGRWTR